MEKMTVDDDILEKRFRRICKEEKLAEGTEWLDKTTKTKLQLVERYLDRIGYGVGARKVLDTFLPFWQAKDNFKDGFLPYISPKLYEMITDAVAKFPTPSIDGYAWDLCWMARAACGPEQPCGWVPFSVIIGAKAVACFTALGFHDDDGGNKITLRGAYKKRLALIGEVIQGLQQGTNWFCICLDSLMNPSMGSSHKDDDRPSQLTFASHNFPRGLEEPVGTKGG
jgi:hypothetical protein